MVDVKIALPDVRTAHVALWAQTRTGRGREGGEGDGGLSSNYNNVKKNEDIVINVIYNKNKLILNEKVLVAACRALQCSGTAL